MLMLLKVLSRTSDWSLDCIQLTGSDATWPCGRWYAHSCSWLMSVDNVTVLCSYLTDVSWQCDSVIHTWLMSIDNVIVLCSYLTDVSWQCDSVMLMPDRCQLTMVQCHRLMPDWCQLTMVQCHRLMPDRCPCLRLAASLHLKNSSWTIRACLELCIITNQTRNKQQT